MSVYPPLPESIAQAGGAATQVEWTPPAGGPRSASALAALTNHPDVVLANRTAFERFSSASPTLMGRRSRPSRHPRAGGTNDSARRPAGCLGGYVRPDARRNHRRRPVRRVGARCRSSQGFSPPALTFTSPRHTTTRAVGPMAGIISPNMPVWSVENSAHGNRAYSTLNEGLGNVLRFGANGPEVIERLRWMREVLAPALQRTLEVSGPMELKPLMAQALHMGDEVHNRNVAASALLLKRIAPALVRTGLDSTTVASVIEFIARQRPLFPQSIHGCVQGNARRRPRYTQ